MSDNVNVKPSTDATAISVATDDVDNVHYPIYKMATGDDGEATLISYDNKLWVQDEASGQLAAKMDGINDKLGGIFALLEAAFEDGISGRQFPDGEL